MRKFIDTIDMFLETILLQSIGIIGLLGGIVLVSILTLCGVEDRSTVIVSIVCFTPMVLTLFWVLLRSLLELFAKK